MNFYNIWILHIRITIVSMFVYRSAVRAFSCRRAIYNLINIPIRTQKTNRAAFMSTTALTAAAIATSAYNENNSTICEDNNKLESFSQEALVHDTYGGITLYLDKINTSFTADEFSKVLSKSLDEWKQEKKRGIWLHIPTELASVVPYCAALGFEFQYATKGLLVMTQWLPDEHSRLPHGPTHQVGVGAIILHPTTGQMLVVQEKMGPAAKRKLWKMPTGLTDPGEDINTAAIREAKEETGLDVDFDRVICIRQAHGGIFNQSDMFFVCLLKLAPKYMEMLNDGKSIPLIPQEEEIEKVQWMDLEDFCGQDLWRGSPLYQEMNNAIVRAVNDSIRETKGIVDLKNKEYGDCKSSDLYHCGFIAKSLPVGFRPGEQTIYLSKL
jgi:8-oxo-dGTP pyrophosphatase MutT (NUDIX family)